jgi:Lar family restriction alleviation protein
MPDNEMKPCPCGFCGDKNAVEARKGVTLWYVRCHGCGASGPTARDERSALSAWNARATAQSEVDAAAKRERERIIAALFQEAENTPCDEDAKVVRDCAELIRSDFSYEAVEQYQDALEATLARAEAAEARAPAQSVGGGETAPDVMKLFGNCDDWGAAEWFERLANAIMEHDKAVMAEDDVSVHIYRNIAASSATELVRGYRTQVRTALSARAVLTDTAREGATSWHLAEETPPVAKANCREFIVAVKRAKTGKVSTFAASYLNAYELEYQDHPCPQCQNIPDPECSGNSGGGCPTTGWYTVTGDDDYAGMWNALYLEKGDEIVGWAEVPQFTAPSNVGTGEGA